MSEPMSVTFLGTAGASPPAGRDAPCFLVNRRILVDTGWYAVDRLLACGMDPLDIDAVLITHSHADHYLALPQLFLYVACGRRKRGGGPLRVGGPAGDVEAIVEQTRRFLRLAGDPALEMEVQVMPIEPGDALDLGGLHVTTCAVRHRMKGLAYRIEEKGGVSVTFSGDTAPHAAIVELAEGTDLLVHDAVAGATPIPAWADRHSTAAGAADVARRGGAKRLALVHMPATGAEAALATAKEIFPDTFLPQEGRNVSLG